MVASFIKSDIKTVLSSKVFGEDDGVVWNKTPVPDAIFDDEDVEVQMGEGPTEIISQPIVTGATCDFIGIKENDSIQVNGETLYVKNWKKDGTGIIEIFLHREKVIL